MELFRPDKVAVAVAVAGVVASSVGVGAGGAGGRREVGEGAAVGDLLGGEGAEGEDEGDGGVCQGGGFEVGEMGPFQGREYDWGIVMVDG